MSAALPCAFMVNGWSVTPTFKSNSALSLRLLVFYTWLLPLVGVATSSARGRCSWPTPSCILVERQNEKRVLEIKFECRFLKMMVWCIGFDV